MTTILENARRVQRGEVPPPPIGRLLGFVLKMIEPGHAVFEMEADERRKSRGCARAQHYLHESKDESLRSQPLGCRKTSIIR